MNEFDFVQEYTTIYPLKNIVVCLKKVNTMMAIGLSILRSAKMCTCVVDGHSSWHCIVFVDVAIGGFHMLAIFT
jgi:hypothetical protein